MNLTDPSRTPAERKLIHEAFVKGVGCARQVMASWVRQRASQLENLISLEDNSPSITMTSIRIQTMREIADEILAYPGM